MAGPMPGVALEQLATRPEQEGKDQAVGLRELERRLERVLRPLSVAEAIARDRLEHVRLDARRSRVERRRGAVDDGRQRLDRPFRVLLAELQGSQRDAGAGAVALTGAHRGEGLTRRVCISHADLHLDRARRDVDREDVLAGEGVAELLRAVELRQGFVVSALAEAQYAAGIVDDHL